MVGTAIALGDDDYSRGYEDGYGEGWTRGKDKARFEIRCRLDEDDHVDECGCDPCVVIREVAAAKAGSQDWIVSGDVLEQIGALIQVMEGGPFDYAQKQSLRAISSELMGHDPGMDEYLAGLYMLWWKLGYDSGIAEAPSGPASARTASQPPQ